MWLYDLENNATIEIVDWSESKDNYTIIYGSGRQRFRKDKLENSYYLIDTDKERLLERAKERIKQRNERHLERLEYARKFYQKKLSQIDKEIKEYKDELLQESKG